jgi:iron-regulated transporter 1
LYSGWLRITFEALFVAFAVVAQLANMTYKIMLERDWMVVVAQGDKSLLASKQSRIQCIQKDVT